MNLESFHRIREFLVGLRGKKIVVVTHKNADPDAIASAFTITGFLKMQKSYTALILPQGANEAGKSMLSSLNVIYDKDILFSKYYHVLDNESVLVIVDTNNPENLGIASKLLNVIRTIVIIDHHRPRSLSFSSNYEVYPLIIPTYTSCSELVYDLLSEIYSINSLEATALLAGIIYDTRRFLAITPRTFKIVSELLNRGGDYHRAISMITRDMDYSERMARLKAAQRMKIFTCRGYIVAISHVGAFEGSAARGMIELGADLAIVYSIRKNMFRVTLRSTGRFYRETGVSIGRDIIPYLIRILNASGGGHDNAGSLEGYRVEGNLEQVIERTVCKLLVEKKNS